MSVILIAMLLIVLQGLFFGFSVITMITYPVFIFGIPYLLYKIIGDNIFDYVVNVIFYTALISTSIWIFQALFSPFDQILQSLRSATGFPLIGGTEDGERVSISMLYTITHWTTDFFGIKVLRNAGLYHEPGAFAYFLILSIGLNTIIQNNILNKKNIIMIIILLTTFSTAGYLSLFVFLIYSIFKSNYNIIIKIISIPIFISMSLFTFVYLDFMNEKIVHEYETQFFEEDSTDEFGGGRVRRIMRSINLLSTSPVLGRGIITASREFEESSPYYFTGAGIWRTLSSYGIILTPIIIIFYILGINKVCRKYNYHKKITYYFFIAIAIGASSQRFFMDNITILLFINGLVNMKVFQKSETKK